MKRTFIAVKIEPGEALVNVLNECRQELAGERISWVQPQNIHITLKFLGDTREGQIQPISGTIRKVAGEHRSFDLKFRNLGVFRNLRNPRVLWVGIERNPVMEEIKHDLDQHLADFGYEPENREFRPHLTLGRIKFLKDLTGLEHLILRYSDQEFQVSGIREIIYYESILKPYGPEYTAIGRMSLA